MEEEDLIPVADPARISSLIYEYDRWAKEAGVLPKSIVDKRTTRKKK